MRKFCSPWAVLALSAVLALPARAGLTWTTREISLHPALDQPDAIAHYKFENTGPDTVTISSVTTSCPCTTAHADKTSYRPGEKGEIVADMSVPIITGLDEKKIFVVSGPKNETTTLDLKVFIPEVMKLTPPALTWKVGESAAPKTVTVEMIAPEKINATEVLLPPDGRHFAATLREVEPHRKYLVTVTPRGTSAPAREMLRIATDYPAYQAKSVFFPVSIVAAP